MLFAIDVAEKSWEIPRTAAQATGRLPQKGQRGEARLQRVDLVGIAPEFQDEAEYHTIQNALSSKVDPVAAAEIDGRLAACGFDQHSISMEVYV